MNGLLIRRSSIRRSGLWRSFGARWKGEKKKAAIEEVLQRLAADPERVKRLAGWRWIQEAIPQLPTEDTAFQ